MKSSLLTTLIKNRSPIIALTGNEPYIVRRAKEAVCARLLPTQNRAININRFEAGSTCDQILTTCKSPPLFSDRRFVLVQDVPSKDLALLADYVLSPRKTTVLCLVLSDLDGRSKLAGALKKTDTLVTFDKLKDAELPGFVQEEAKRLGIELASGAAHHLISIVGSDLAQLIDGLTRCMLWADPGAAITQEDMNAVLATTRIDSVFALTDGIGSRQALIVLENLIAAQQAPQAILALLSGHVRKLRIAETCQDGTQTAAALGGAHPFYANKIHAQAKALGPNRVHALYDALYQAEVGMKGGRRMDPRMILEEVMINQAKR